MFWTMPSLGAPVSRKLVVFGVGGLFYGLVMAITLAISERRAVLRTFGGPVSIEERITARRLVFGQTTPDDHRLRQAALSLANEIIARSRPGAVAARFTVGLVGSVALVHYIGPRAWLLAGLVGVELPVATGLAFRDRARARDYVAKAAVAVPAP